jgi:integrase
MRAVPLQLRALERPFQWLPAQKAAEIKPFRRIYDLRHTFATFALRAGISTFDLSPTWEPV